MGQVEHPQTYGGTVVRVDTLLRPPLPVRRSVVCHVRGVSVTVPPVNIRGLLVAYTQLVKPHPLLIVVFPLGVHPFVPGELSVFGREPKEELPLIKSFLHKVVLLK